MRVSLSAHPGSHPGSLGSLRRFRRLSGLPVIGRAADPVPRPGAAKARSRYVEVDSLLRRNEHMLLAEQLHLAQRLADSEAVGDSYWDLLLYELFGCESKCRRQQAAVFRRRRAHLNRVQLLVGRASAALDGGNLELAEKILIRTSPQLGILTDDAAAESIADIPVLGDPMTVTACSRAS